MRFAFIALAALGLSGCIELPGSGPAPNYYTISALDGATEKLPAPVLFLEDPTAPGELSGRELAVARDNGQIAFVAQSIWAERTQSMVLRHLVTSFDHLSRYSTVGGVRSLDVPSDYSLKLDLRRFHALDGGRVEVEIAAILMDRGPSKVIAAERFQTEGRISGDTTGDIVAALDLAMDALAQQMIKWSDAQLAAASARAHSE